MRKDLEAFISEGAWRERLWELLAKPAAGGPANVLERHLAQLLDGDHPQCPCCYRPLSQSRFLLHLATHAWKSNRGAYHLHYSLPCLKPERAKLFGSCFVGPCTTRFFNSQHVTDYGEQLREHLLTHEEQDLAVCGFNWRLLAEDRNRVNGQSPTFEAAGSRRAKLDPGLLRRVSEWIRPGHLETLVKIARLIKDGKTLEDTPERPEEQEHGIIDKAERDQLSREAEFQAALQELDLASSFASYSTTLPRQEQGESQITSMPEESVRSFELGPLEHNPSGPGFVLERALAARLSQGKSGQGLYRPYVFAARFTRLIGPKFLLEPELFFVDRHGTRWRRVDATEVQQYDLGELQSTVREEVFARELYWLERL